MKTIKDLENEIPSNILSHAKELIKTSLDKSATYLYVNSSYSKTEAWEAATLLFSYKPITHALQAIHAIALKKGFPAEDIIGIQYNAVDENWHYQLKNMLDWITINLSNESNGK
jgi:hypothetical protein